jgi:hypothetical protein
MAFNPEQFRPKKKRAVDPNAPPRPNLLSQDKKLREQQDIITDLYRRLSIQSEQLDQMRIKYESMQQSISQILNYLRKGK